MKLITYYQTGKIDVFDTATFTATDPFKRDGMNLITEFAIRFDLLEDKNSNEGLAIYISMRCSKQGPLYSPARSMI